MKFEFWIQLVGTGTNLMEPFSFSYDYNARIKKK